MKNTNGIKVTVSDYSVNDQGEVRAVIRVKGFEADEHGKIHAVTHEEEVVLNKKIDKIFQRHPFGMDPRMGSKL